MFDKSIKKRKRHRNKKKYTKKEFCVIICAILLFIALVFLLYRFVQPFYKVESRVDNIKKKDKEIEEDVIGWIRVQGTNVDLPIVFNTGNLHMDRGYSYAWSNQRNSNVNSRKVLFGHNILNLSSNPQIGNKNYSGFEDTLAFLYPSFLKKNKYIQYTVDGKDYIYKIFAVAFVKTGTSGIYSNYMDKDDIAEYIKQAKKDSYFDFDVDVDKNDGIITLATCTRFFGAFAGYSFRIDGRLVRNGEIMSNYDFKEKKNYNKVKKKLKGDETNEKA